MDLSAYIGIPFVELGRGRAGTDCWGLVRMIYAGHLGIDLPSMDGTYRDHQDERIPGLIAEHAKAWRRVEVPQPYDVVLLHQDGRLQHIAMVVDGQWMVHAVREAEVCLDRYRAPEWWPAIEGFYRYDGRA